MSVSLPPRRTGLDTALLVGILGKQQWRSGCWTGPVHSLAHFSYLDGYIPHSLRATLLLVGNQCSRYHFCALAFSLLPSIVPLLFSLSTPFHPACRASPIRPPRAPGLPLVSHRAAAKSAPVDPRAPSEDTRRRRCNTGWRRLRALGTRVGDAASGRGSGEQGGTCAAVLRPTVDALGMVG